MPGLSLRQKRTKGQKMIIDRRPMSAEQRAELAELMLTHDSIDLEHAAVETLMNVLDKKFVSVTEAQHLIDELKLMPRT